MVVVWIAALFLLVQPVLAKDGEVRDPKLDELIEILRERGVLEPGDEEALEKAAAENPSKLAEWLERISIWGDFRGRYEYFTFFDDPVDGQKDRGDRHRLRYRLRLNASGHVNEYADVFLRLATGNDSRSTNNTLGDGFDFDTNEIFLDKAYVRVSPFAGGQLPSGDGTLYGYFGRTHQPWRWGIYKDWIWDDEIAPAGAYLQGDKQLGDFELFGNAGFYVIDENGNDKDPSMVAGQLGFHATPEVEEDDVDIDYGAKLALFNFFNLDDGFIARGVDSSGISSPTFSAGNTLGGLTGDPTGGSLSVLEFGAYVTLGLLEGWPLSIYGNVSNNFDAERVTVVNAAGTAIPGTFRADHERTFWVVGFDFGDKKECLKFRMLYAWMEANAFPSQFIDSDLHDGVTNRKGFVWGLTKTVYKNTDLSATAFLMDPIKTNGAYLNSLAGSDRFRLQANVVYSF
jgi:hypothetical protein